MKVKVTSLAPVTHLQYMDGHLEENNGPQRELFTTTFFLFMHDLKPFIPEMKLEPDRFSLTRTYVHIQSDTLLQLFPLCFRSVLPVFLVVPGGNTRTVADCSTVQTFRSTTPS